MLELTFDHSKENYADSIGVTNAELKELMKKYAGTDVNELIDRYPESKTISEFIVKYGDTVVPVLSKLPKQASVVTEKLVNEGVKSEDAIAITQWILQIARSEDEYVQFILALVSMSKGDF